MLVRGVGTPVCVCVSAESNSSYPQTALSCRLLPPKASPSNGAMTQADSEGTQRTRSKFQRPEGQPWPISAVFPPK